MNCSASFVIFTLIFIVEMTGARIYYDNRHPNIYYTTDESSELASRDLDMTFSAGDPSNYDSNIIYPLRKDFMTRTRIPVVDMIHRENDRPTELYKWPMKVPAIRRIIYGGDSSTVHENDENQDLVKFNSGHKGEVVLELRVIANNDGFK